MSSFTEPCSVQMSSPVRERLAPSPFQEGGHDWTESIMEILVSLPVTALHMSMWQNCDPRGSRLGEGRFWERFSHFSHSQEKEIRGIPCCSKVCITPFLFYKRPTLTYIFTNQKKPKKDFCFAKKKKKKKRWKAKIAFSVSFAVSSYKGSADPQQWEWSHQVPSPNYTQYLAT